MLDLVGSDQGIVDAGQEGGYAIHRVKALIGVGLGGSIGVASYLPAAKVNGFQTGLYLLYGLGASLRSQGGG